tara:strand:- start:297 stop:527 length:231 start_codon:yes stop_codon:yes gene_type:complete
MGLWELELELELELASTAASRRSIIPLVISTLPQDGQWEWPRRVDLTQTSETSTGYLAWVVTVISRVGWIALRELM